jgi:hypothetical protein
MAGLAGSGHCLGMCGGILGALAVAGPLTSAGQRFRLNIAYHVGRIVTYTLLGLLAGAVSQAALFSSLKTHLYWLFAVANIMVIIIGLATVFGLHRLSLAVLDGVGCGFMFRFLGAASRQETIGTFLLAGLVMGLLPCGLIYGVLISSATRGSCWQGGGMMLAFGLGTLPALLAYGQVATSLGAISTTVILRLMGVVVALLGVTGLLKALVEMGIMPPVTLW